MTLQERESFPLFFLHKCVSTHGEKWRHTNYAVMLKSQCCPPFVKSNDDWNFFYFQEFVGGLGIWVHQNATAGMKWRDNYDVTIGRGGSYVLWKEQSLRRYLDGFSVSHVSTSPNIKYQINCDKSNIRKRGKQCPLHSRREHVFPTKKTNKRKTKQEMLINGSYVEILLNIHAMNEYSRHRDCHDETLSWDNKYWTKETHERIFRHWTSQTMPRM